MRYEEFGPPAALSHCVEAFWRFSLDNMDPPELAHPIVPDGAVSLAGAFWNDALVSVEIVGPSQTAQQAQLVRGMHVLGARLWPGACLAMLGIAPQTIVGQMQAVPPDHWAMHAFHGGIEGLASALAQRTETLPRPDPLIAAAAHQLEVGAPVAMVAANLGLSPRQLHRRFTRAAGLAPKTWQRVRRQRLAWIHHVMGEAANMTDTAHSAGFSDSAHFSREARRAFQLPAQQVAAYLALIHHGPLRR